MTDNGLQTLSTGELKEIIIESRVLRCTCGNPDAHRGEPCPTGRWEEKRVEVHWQAEQKETA